MVRIYSINVRSRPAAIALAAAALAAGAVFVAFGIVLLLGVVAVGTVVGAGVVLYRSLTERGRPRVGGRRGDDVLDPAREVFPPASAPQAPHRLTSPEAREP
jgi:hypothetical protein